MTPLEEIEALIADPTNDMHCVYIGRCTMAGSPGRFAMANNDIGRSLYGAEGRTAEDALTKMLGKVKRGDMLPRPEDAMRQAVAAFDRHLPSKVDKALTEMAAADQAANLDGLGTLPAPRTMPAPARRAMPGM